MVCIGKAAIICCSCDPTHKLLVCEYSEYNE